MSYDHWKTRSDLDENPYAEVRLKCGCWNVCDPFAHDTCPDWDGRPSGPAWDDLSPEEQKSEHNQHLRPDYGT